MRNEVKICNVKFKIKEKDVIDENSDGIVEGLIEYSKAKIYLRKDMPKRLKGPVLYHGIVHGILIQLGYSELNEDEVFVQQMSNALYQMFKLR